MNLTSRHLLKMMAGASCHPLTTMDRMAVTRSVCPQFHRAIRLVSGLSEVPRLQVSVALWGSYE
jgi:hypothetical protein